MHQNQRGATLVLVALWMSIALAALLVLDIGHLFWQKRDLQKIADLAALSGARQPVASVCAPAARSVAQSNGLLASDNFTAVAGTWAGQPSGSVAFQPSALAANACHVAVKRVVPYFFIWPAQAGTGREIAAEATAATKSRLARLALRTTLATLNTQDSVLLNALVGGMLGGNLNLSLMGWQGLVGLDVNLLKYLDLLAVQLNLDVGNYTQLLETQVGVGELLNVMIKAVEQNNSTATVALNALRDIAALAVRVPSLRMKLSELLSLQSGLPQQALDVNLNVLELVKGVVQVGNSHSALAGVLEIPLGLANVAVHLKIIEPPTLSAIGDPELARLNPTGADKIFVRSAQTRILLSVDLPVVGGLTTVLNGLLTLVSPVLSLVNLLTGGGTGLLDLEVLPAPVRIDVGVDIAAGQAYVTNYSCDANNKHVEAQVRTAVADLRLGSWGDTAAQAAQNAFSTTSLASMKPLTLLRLDCIGCKGLGVRTPQYFGGQGIKLDVPVVASKPDTRMVLQPVTALDEAIVWGKSSSVEGLVASLGPTVMGLKALHALPADPSASPQGVQGLLNAVSGILSQVLSLVNSLIVTVLAPLLDPILDSLLKILGVKLAGADYGAQLTCGSGAELVY